MTDRTCHSPAHATELRLQAAREAGDAAAALLRRAGCRPTAQRLLVLQALGGGGHVTAEEVLAHARESFLTINPSTVYRTLEALVTAGLVRRTNLGADRHYYEMARTHRHHHAVCQECGAIAHVHDEALDPLGASLRAETGYVLSPDREIALPGVCPACQGAPSPAAPDHGHDEERDRAHR